MINEESLSQWVRQACQRLGAPQEARWILEYVEHKPQSLALAQSIIARREKGEPLAYTLGNWAFREYEFEVGSGVLIPRPETEELVELALARALPIYLKATGDFVVYDLGAGSGCIGLSFVYDLLRTAIKHRSLHELAPIHLHLVERSTDAAAYLQKNVGKFLSDEHLQKHLDLSSAEFAEKVRVQIEVQDWLEALKRAHANVVVSNPPYLSHAEWLAIDDSVRRFEPVAALVPDRDQELALQPYRELLNWAQQGLKEFGFIATEIGQAQVDGMAVLESEFKNVKKTLSYDMSGKPRFLHFTNSSPTPTQK